MNGNRSPLHQKSFQKPGFTDLKKKIELTRREVRDCLDKVQRRKLMQLVDAQTLLQEQISLVSFTAGFKLAWGIAKELEWNDIQREEQDREVNENG